MSDDKKPSLDDFTDNTEELPSVDEFISEEVVEECAAFPFGENDDLVDSVTQALLRYRQGGLITHPEDYQEEPLPRGKKSYYW